ncbi:hypothetical protein B0H12DRAFT_298235 [Mycena haematopus]|nr:hypothetical protein B0H12DRAFT_298235 [Mycena haematopus]
MNTGNTMLTANCPHCSRSCITRVPDVLRDFDIVPAAIYSTRHRPQACIILVCVTGICVTRCVHLSHQLRHLPNAQQAPALGVHHVEPQLCWPTMVIPPRRLRRSTSTSHTLILPTASTPAWAQASRYHVAYAHPCRRYTFARCCSLCSRASCAAWGECALTLRRVGWAICPNPSTMCTRVWSRPHYSLRSERRPARGGGVCGLTRRRPRGGRGCFDWMHWGAKRWSARGSSSAS